MDGQFTIELTPQMLAVIPMIAFLVQPIKGAWGGRLTPWTPYISAAFGVGAAVLLAMGGSIGQQVFSGILMGLSASGGYDMARSLEKAKSSGGGS